MIRLLIIVFFLAVFLTIGYAVTNVSKYGTGSGSGPAPKSMEFIKHVQASDYKAAVGDFGVNTCRCPGSLGWVSYLVYASNESENLSFLVGKEFQTGKPQARKIATTAKSTSWMDNPEDWEVNIPIKFDSNVYRPYFLPLDMAYGHEMSEEAFRTFLADPDKDAWKGFCLRLRPSLEAGVTDLPAEAKALEKKGHDAQSRENAVKGENENVEAIAKNLFGDEATKYMHPAAPGKVKRADGTYLNTEEIAAALPRVDELSLKMHMVRRDQRLPFSLYQFLVVDPLLTLPALQKGEQDKKLALRNFLAPVFNEATHPDQKQSLDEKAK